MSAFAPVTDTDLAQARGDRAFRQKLLAENLEILLDALNALRKAARSSDAEQARQIREGVELAMQLSDRLHRLAGDSGQAA
jgi:hypothetical protein